MRDPRLSRFALVTGLALAAGPFVGLAPAYACSCAAAPESEHLADADVVFKGTVLKRIPPPARPGGVQSSADLMTYVFKVSRSYKGKVAKAQRVRSPVSGASCGLELSGKGPFLVFANRQAPKAKVLHAGLCGGTRPIGAKEEPSFAAPGPAPQAQAQAKPKPVPSEKPAAPTGPEGEPLPAAPGAPVVPVVPVDPIAPAERNALRAVNSVAVGAQDFANRLVGPLFPH